MATKKKRKSTKPRKPAAPPKFSVGDQVRVKYGIADPDFPDIPLGGWAGTITEVDQRGQSPMYLIEWNQSTLDNMHPIFRKRCERDGLEETSSWQGEEDLEADVGEPVPMEQPTNIVTRPLNKNDQDDRIRAILGLTGDDPLPEANGENLCKYYEYLTANLSFPFPAIYWKETGRSKAGSARSTSWVWSVSMTTIPVRGTGCYARSGDPKEATTVVQGRARNRGGLLGFLGNILGLPASQKKEEVEEDRCLPLDEMEVKKDSPNRRLIADYSYWFHNH